MKILKYCVIYNMLNLITFLQTISDSDYGYNFLVLKFWNIDMHFASQWYYYYLLTHIKPGMFLSKNYCCKKKWGRRAVFNAIEQGQKKPWWHTALQHTEKKNTRRKKEKNGGQGHSQDFFQESRGGVTLFQTESTHHFFATWIL